jgi:uncharacterized SAM-binding protein YcdF (DUF218 family)
MPRAVALFEARGLTPTPAPTGYLGTRVPGFRMLDLVPDAGSLSLTRRAWYELLGRTWALVRGDL